MRSVPISVALALALAGCAVQPPGTDAGPSDAGPVSLTLGTGLRELTPIVPHQTLLLAHGCQGLQHVFIALRATGINYRGVHVRLSLERLSDGAAVSAEFYVALGFVPDGSGAVEYDGIQLVVPTPDDALGMPLVLRGELMDREGRSVSASEEVTLAWGTEVCGT